MPKHREEGQATDLAEFQQASRFWRAQVVSQIKVILGVAVGAAVVIASASYPWGANSPPLLAAFKQMSLTGGMSSQNALVVVSSLAALVGALSVALVVAPRVDDERTAVDRVALARWGQILTRANAIASGLCVGIAFTQVGGPPAPESVLMLSLSVIVAAVSAVSVQRLHDAVRGRLAEACVANTDDALQRLLPNASGRRGRSKWTDFAQSLSGYLIYPLTLALVAVAVDAFRTDANALVSWPYLRSLLSLFTSAAFIGAFIAAPWQIVLRWRIRRKALEQSWHASWWLLGSCTGCFIAFVTLVPTEPTDSWSVRVGAICVVLLPTTAIAMFLAALGLRTVGPWSESWRSVERDMQQEFVLAKQRADSIHVAATAFGSGRDVRS